MNRYYDYRKTFFRRPLLTRDNIRFWVITVIVGVFSTLTVYFSGNLVGKIPTRAFSESVKKKYVLFLVKERARNLGRKNVPGMGESGGTKNVAEFKPAYVIRKDNHIRNAVSRVRKNRSSYAERLKKQGKERGLYRRMISTEAGSPEAITAALDGVAGFAGLPEYSFRRERNLTLRNEENYLKEYEKPIDIPKPEVFHFASQNGNRSLEETTAVMSLNEHDVKYCIDKSKRYDPTFTGDILVRFTIHPNGYVIPSSIKIIKSNINDFRVINCIKKSIRRWRNFPKIALDDGSFTVTRKYVF